MKTQADVGIGPVSCENCSVFKKGEGGPEAPGALRLRNKKATASVASSYSQNPPVYRGIPPIRNSQFPIWAKGKGVLGPSKTAIFKKSRYYRR